MPTRKTPIYYAIKKKRVVIDHFLPAANKGRGGIGFTTVEPTCLEPPRLFTSRSAAKRAFTWWLKGPTQARSYVDTDTWDTADGYSVVLESTKIPYRRSEDYSIVPVRIVPFG